MEIADIKALISPNRPGGVSAFELKQACKMLDDFDSFTREAVTGLVDISRRERARAEAAEVRVEAMCDLYNRQSDMLDAAKDAAEATEADNARLLAANAMLAADLGAAWRERDATQAEVGKWKENNGILLDTANRLRAERNAAVDRANPAELELSQERFMRQAAEAEVQRLREELAAWT